MCHMLLGFFEENKNRYDLWPWGTVKTLNHPSLYIV